MTQTRLIFPGDRASEHDERLRRAIDAAVRSIGVDRLAEATGADAGDISRAMNGKRVWQQRWTTALLDLPELDEKHAAAIIDAIAARRGRKSAPRQPRSVRAIAEQALAALRKFGEMGAGVADELEEELNAALDKEGYR